MPSAATTIIETNSAVIGKLNTRALDNLENVTCDTFFATWLLGIIRWCINVEQSAKKLAVESRHPVS